MVLLDSEAMRLEARFDYPSRVFHTEMRTWRKLPHG